MLSRRPLSVLLPILLALKPVGGAMSVPVSLDLAIDEELPPGRQVANLRLELERRGHPVSSRGIELDFRLFNSNPRGVDRYFRLHPESGLLSVSRRLDRDNLCSEAAACCNANLQCQMALQVQSDREWTYIVSVNVVIKDLNDNAPAWDVKEIFREFSEGSTIGDFRTIPAAQDPDSRRNSVQRYEILPPKPVEFELEQHETVGTAGVGTAANSASDSPSTPTASPLRLYLRRRLDRESRDVYRMQIAAFDGGNPPLNGTVWLVVTVADENDEIPTFEKPKYEASVLETASPGTEIIQLKATDRDAGPNGQVVYSIPAFAPARIRSLFSIDADTGVLRVAGPLDYEKQNEYRVTVVAEDRAAGGSSRQSDTQVLIRLLDANDEKPLIVPNSETGRLSVAENEPAKRTVTLMTVTDKDTGVNGQVECSLTSHLDKFSLERLSSKVGSAHYNLVTARPLDRETDAPAGESIQLNVRCVDNGQPQNTVEQTIPVDILDRNDNAPSFAMAAYHFRVNERTAPGTTVFALTATDRDSGRNSRLTFWLNGTDLFSIGPHSGQATLIQRLDRERRDRLEFTAGVTDQGDPPLIGTARVVVLVEDDNEHSPVVQDTYNFRVMEDAEVGHVIGRINATDADKSDSNRLNYRIATEFPPGSNSLATIDAEIFRLFRLEERDGRLILAASLDRESQPRHQFPVEVSDPGGRRATTRVIVDVEDANDCRPRFVYPAPGNNSLRIRPDTQVAASVATLLAVDADDPKAGLHGNGRVRYDIVSPPLETLPFHLDAETGELVLVRPLPPSLLSGRPLKLQIRARDGGQPTLETRQTLVVTLTGSDVAAAAAAAAAASGGSTTSIVTKPIDSPAKPWLPNSGVGGDGSEQAGGSAGANSESLLLAAGLASVTCAFVLILGLGVGVIICRRHCFAALVGQSQQERPTQHEQNRHQQQLLLGSGCSDNGTRRLISLGRRRGSPGVDCRDDSAAAAAAAASETLPMTTSSGRFSTVQLQRNRLLHHHHQQQQQQQQHPGVVLPLVSSPDIGASSATDTDTNSPSNSNQPNDQLSSTGNEGSESSRLLKTPQRRQADPETTGTGGCGCGALERPSCIDLSAPLPVLDSSGRSPNRLNRRPPDLLKAAHRTATGSGATGCSPASSAGAHQQPQQQPQLAYITLMACEQHSAHPQLEQSHQPLIRKKSQSGAGRADLTARIV